MKIVYEKHPVTPERKRELVSEGYRIIDARFAPDSDHSHRPSKTDIAVMKKADVADWLAKLNQPLPDCGVLGMREALRSAIHGGE